MEHQIGDKVMVNTVNGERGGVVENIWEGLVLVRLDIGKRTLICPKREIEETESNE